MSSDPPRIVDDPEAPEGLASLLALGGDPSPALPPDLQAEVAQQLSELAASGVVGGASGFASKLLVTGELVFKKGAAAAGAGLSTTAGKFTAVAAFSLTVATAPMIAPRWLESPASEPSTEEAEPLSQPLGGPQTQPIVDEEFATREVATLGPARTFANDGVRSPAPDLTGGSSPQNSPANDSTGATSPRPSGRGHRRTRREEGGLRVARPTRADLTEEARLLETARGHLSSSPASTLRLTEDHRRRFPSGQLEAERELIAVEALLRLGRRDRAEERATSRLLRDGLYARRVGRLLSRDE